MEHVVNKKTHEDSCGRGIGPSKRLHSNNTQHSQERCQFESTPPSKQAENDRRLKPCGHHNWRRRAYDS